MGIIYYATTIDFGPGAIDKLSGHCRRLSIERPLIVTDTGLAKTGIPARAVGALSAFSPRLFDGINPNPIEAEVDSGIEAFKDWKADGLIAIGGGSAIDAAKAIGLIVSNGGRLGDFAVKMGGRREIARELPPIVAVPTIAGSGSEISRGLGVGVGKSGSKANILDPALFPKVALCDPSLTLSVPRETAILSALDALTHCLEAIISPVYNPPAASVAKDGALRLFRNLDQLFLCPDDPEVRSEIMMGSIQGGMAMPKGLGPAHGIGIPLDRLHLSHGAIVARLMPKVVRWYGRSLDVRMAELRSALGLESNEDVADALEALNDRLDIRGGLHSLGVPHDIVDEIGNEAANSPYAGICLRQADNRDYAALLSSAM